MRQRSKPVGRYAPSPTGDLHPGNLRTALIAHDEIRSRDGTFILRIEDTDLPRNVEGAGDRIIEDLQWLGITWDEGPDIGGPAGPYLQSERQDLYLDILERLISRNLIYACSCSRKDLQSAASAPHGPEGPIYPATCRLRLQPAEPMDIAKELLTTPGRDHGLCLRLRTDKTPKIPFMDELHGIQYFESESSGDFVVLRRDGLWAYQFVCAVDDGLMGVDRVVRGEDLLHSTPRQVALLSILDFTVPVYRHIPLAADDKGQRLSKRDGSFSLRQLKAKGLSPEECREVILSLRDVNP